MSKDPTSQDKLTDLLDELEDAIWCSRSDNVTQAKAAEQRAKTAREAINRHYTPKTEQQAIEDAILDEKMSAILEMINTFISDRSDYPFKPAKIMAERPLDYEPLVRQIRDFAHVNTTHGRHLDRALAAVDRVIEALDNRDKEKPDAR